MVYNCVKLCYYNLKEEELSMNNEEGQDLTKSSTSEVLDITMPLHKLLFLLLITFTLYTPFWFYSKCKHLKDAKGRNILLALATGIPFLCVIPLFVLYKNLLNLFYSSNKKKILLISFSLSFLLFSVIYSLCLYLNITSSILFSICFYIPSLLIIQFIINNEKQNAT